MQIKLIEATKTYIIITCLALITANGIMSFIYLMLGLLRVKR